MYLCYVDESGTPEVPGTTSHYVLAALAIPEYKWKICESEVNAVKQRYGLLYAEIHTGWLIRPYPEQKKIPNFDLLPQVQRKSEVERIRRTELLRLQSNSKFNKQYKQVKKNYAQTHSYIHLTLDERKAFVFEVAQTIGNWGFARLFAECVDKVFFDPNRTNYSVDEQAFEQVVSRFQQYLASKESNGILIHDNNETVAKKHTQLMQHFHRQGTFWTFLNNIIETPLFVDSTLTSMIQMADICCYAIRRYLENKEEKLFDEIYKRADRRGSIVVGVRHFCQTTCKCTICTSHKPTSLT